MTPAALTAFVADIDQIARTHCSGGGEVEMVARMFRSPAAVRAWRGALRKLFRPQGIQSTYNTVFCHGKPYVNFTRPGRVKKSKCELADALVVINDHTTKERRALLLQAKRGKKWPPDMRHHQWYLYTNWPTFDYALGTIQRIRSLGPTTWGEYLLVASSTPPDICVPVQTATPRAFSSSMAQLVFGAPAHDFEYDILTAKSPTDWDALVWDLLLSTGADRLPLYGRPKIADTRGNRVTYMAHDERLMDLWKGFGGMGPGVINGDDDDYNGFTIAIIDLEEDEQQ